MDIAAASASLVQHFRKVHEERMQGLPILNARLDVRAVGFREFDGHAVGVLITPWFMNLVLLPGVSAWSELAQGSVATVAFPGSEVEFNVSHDDELGTHLSAVLFSTVADFPDTDTAVAIAEEVLNQLFQPPEESTAAETPSISRRELFSRLGAG
jgi:[NiFe] hydrogenase assembly HybE family chaperone